MLLIGTSCGLIIEMAASKICLSISNILEPLDSGLPRVRVSPNLTYNFFDMLYYRKGRTILHNVTMWRQLYKTKMAKWNS